MANMFPERQQAVVDKITSGATLTYNSKLRQYSLKQDGKTENVSLDTIKGLMARDAVKASGQRDAQGDYTFTLNIAQ